MGITVLRGGVPFSVLIKLFLLPLSFLILSIVAIVFQFSSTGEGLLFFIKIGSAGIGFSKTGVITGLNLFLKAMSAVSCLYFLVLTMPLMDFLSALGRMKLPSLMVQLMGLVYRFIFILLETAEAMYTAQKSRLGYHTLKGGYRSMGSLIANLFFRSYKKAEALYTGLEARGYEGELNVLEESADRWHQGYGSILMIDGLLAATTLFIRSMK